MFCPHLSFIISLLFYTVFQFYSNYNSSKVRREHPTLHPVEKSIMEVEIMLSLITIDTENCKSDFFPLLFRHYSTNEQRRRRRSPTSTASLGD